MAGLVCVHFMRNIINSLELEDEKEDENLNINNSQKQPQIDNQQVQAQSTDTNILETGGDLESHLARARVTRWRANPILEIQLNRKIHYLFGDENNENGIINGIPVEYLQT
ncbi:MAG: hypothetical protein HUJ51_04555 [Eggerthellaceae bacterium]|nr:hypothetical protein [Eggerthellaceae bacterium]